MTGPAADAGAPPLDLSRPAAELFEIRRTPMNLARTGWTLAKGILVSAMTGSTDPALWEHVRLHRRDGHGPGLDLLLGIGDGEDRLAQIQADLAAMTGHELVEAWLPTTEAGRFD